VVTVCGALQDASPERVAWSWQANDTVTSLLFQPLALAAGDWVWLIAEEIVRAVLWFHPGVWWLISRVQLAREEVVDELAMLATGTRRGYIEALAAFADDPRFLDDSPLEQLGQQHRHGAGRQSEAVAEVGRRERMILEIEDRPHPSHVALEAPAFDQRADRGVELRRRDLPVESLQAPGDALGASSRDADGETLAGEAPGDGEADAASAAGDECDPRTIVHAAIVYDRRRSRPDPASPDRSATVR